MRVTPKHGDLIAQEPLRQVPGDRLVPDGRDQPVEHQEQAECHHDHRAERRAVERPHEHALHHEREHRSDDEEHDHEGQHRVPTPALPQLPVQVGHHHAHRAVGEVEDPRGLVRDHEATRGHRIDRPRDQPGDDEADELVHDVLCAHHSSTTAVRVGRASARCPCSCSGRSPRDCRRSPPWGRARCAAMSRCCTPPQSSTARGSSERGPDSRSSRWRCRT